MILATVAMVIRGAIESLLHALRFDRALYFALARGNYSEWQQLDTAAEGLDRTSWPTDCRRRFRRAAVVDAYAYVRDRQTAARVLILWAVLGVAASLAFWAVFVTGAARESLFLAESVAVVAVATVLSLPYLIYGLSAPVPMLVVGMGSAVVGWTWLWLSGDIGAALAGEVPAGAEIGVSFLVFAAGCLVGAVCFSVAFVTFSVLTGRRHRSYCFEQLVVLGADFLHLVRDAAAGLPAWPDGTHERRAPVKRQAIRELGYIVDGLRKAGRSLPPADAREVVGERFELAARAVREYQVWIALEQPGTLAEVRAGVARITFAVLTGYFHDLPQPRDPGAGGAGRSRTFLQVTRQLVVGVVPVGVVVALPWVGVGLPSPVQQWVTGLALLWLVTRVVAVLDPGGTLTPRDVQELFRFGRQ